MYELNTKDNTIFESIMQKEIEQTWLENRFHIKKLSTGVYDIKSLWIAFPPFSLVDECLSVYMWVDVLFKKKEPMSLMNWEFE